MSTHVLLGTKDMFQRKFLTHFHNFEFCDKLKVAFFTWQKLLVPGNGGNGEFRSCICSYKPRGALSIYTGGGVPRHIQKGGSYARHNTKRGVLGTGTTQKRGVLGTGTSRKRGGLRHGHESKKGSLKNWSCKKDNLGNWCCTKGGFGSLFINYPYFCLVNMINWWGFTLTD